MLALPAKAFSVIGPPAVWNSPSHLSADPANSWVLYLSVYVNKKRNCLALLYSVNTRPSPCHLSPDIRLRHHGAIVSRAASFKRPLLSVDVSVCLSACLCVCLSATLMLNISETKRFSGFMSKSSHSKTMNRINYPREPFEHTLSCVKNQLIRLSTLTEEAFGVILPPSVCHTGSLATAALPYPQVYWRHVTQQ